MAPNLTLSIKSCSTAWLAALLALLLCMSPTFCLAETTVRDFRVGWVLANPDGAFDRPTIGINGQWPIPQLKVTVGDRMILNVHNDLGNTTTSLHFHGLFQNGTNHMDGAVGVTQCAISPGSSFTYDILFEQPGTYWYHSHSKGQYMDGLRGAIVVHDPTGPYEGEYDEEIVLSISDWYHELSIDLIDQLISVKNPTGAEPVPHSALINDTQNLKIPIKPDTTYLVRFVNIGGFAAQYVWFEGHSMQIVEVDGVWTEPANADMLYITPAQRYSVLLTTRGDMSANFALICAMDEDLFDVIPEGQNSNTTAWLVYDATRPLPEPQHIESFEAAFFNDITYIQPKVPSLYTTLSVGGTNANNRIVYGSHTNTHIFKRHDVIELILNNGDDGRHPFHLHGHNFQVVHRSGENDGVFNPNDYAASDFPRVPMRRDTLFVEGNGNFVIRFRADNPGVWLFHCHIEWHMDQGLVATFVEAPEALQSLQVPDSHFEVCRAAGKPTVGNAAGNSVDIFDLEGENKPPGRLPEGFTAKGYVALFFSTVAALLGMAAIAWYGLIDPNVKDQSADRQLLINREGE
ncbi:hypothetical protein SEPCBS57363_005851 [Sporothrix epigloea]|uniref:Ferrooxidoreductase Fet3 n=1 Tax=Sporothrix epigloea TaxID=1892477 RepID=A0ABP0E078_9PEZI